MLKSNLGILRLIGFLEGISFLLLLGLGMPLKYIWKNESLMMPIGMTHGLLFVAFIIWVFVVSAEHKKGFKFIFLSGIASILPFGTFVADAKIFKPMSS